uniref:Pyridoxamine 5'-phosphate oxidase n=1 Tax=Angiostrongylus cantonensis TaxID=6313 RepID=A0A0K0CSQ7_ANGCA
MLKHPIPATHRNASRLDQLVYSGTLIGVGSPARTEPVNMRYDLFEKDSGGVNSSRKGNLALTLTQLSLLKAKRVLLRRQVGLDEKEVLLSCSLLQLHVSPFIVTITENAARCQSPAKALDLTFVPKFIMFASGHRRKGRISFSSADHKKNYW